MNASILTIGNELLIGKTKNTNAAFIAVEVQKEGIHVQQMSVVGDSKDDIIKEIDFLLQDSNVLIITGGLGPTRDDITKLALSQYLNRRLIIDKQYYNRSKKGYEERNIHVSEPVLVSNSEIVEKSTPLQNRLGTALGMYIDDIDERKVVIALPGVPIEMEAMLLEEVLPRLRKKSNHSIKHTTIMTTGISEVMLSEKIELAKISFNSSTTLAFLPHLRGVSLRVSTVSKDDQEQADAENHHAVEKILSVVGDYVYSTKDDLLEKVIVDLLVDRRLTIATAESCTGGLLSHWITNVDGSSKCFHEGAITYSNDAKVRIGVDEKLIKEKGAVSQEVCLSLAKMVRNKTGVDIGVSVTGIAGPCGATKQKPVGLAWVGISTGKDLNFYSHEEKIFSFKDRETNKVMFAQAALNIIWKAILEQ